MLKEVGLLISSISQLSKDYKSFKFETEVLRHRFSFKTNLTKAFFIVHSLPMLKVQKFQSVVKVEQTEMYRLSIWQEAAIVGQGACTQAIREIASGGLLFSTPV